MTQRKVNSQHKLIQGFPTLVYTHLSLHPSQTLMESQINVENTTYMGKFEFASFTSISINPLLKGNEIALGLMRHQYKKPSRALLQCAQGRYRHIAI